MAMNMSEDPHLPRVSKLSPDRRALLEKRMRGQHAPLSETVPGTGSTGPIPLSLYQRRLWFLDQLQPGNTAYQIPEVRRIAAPVNITVLERSINLLAERHDTLRTTIVTHNGSPHQAIAKQLQLELPLIDLRSFNLVERELKIRQRIAEEVAKPFDLSVGPLIRCTVLRAGDADHIFLVTMHHIISDAWSITVFFRELDLAYGAILAGVSPAFSPLKIQYADYALRQRREYSGQRSERELVYWIRKLAGLSTLNLPTDRPRPAMQSFRGARHWLELPAALTTALKILSRDSRTTLFMTLLAGFYVLLARYSGQEDIALGTAVSGRDRPELEGLIGFFVNSVVLRGDLSGDPSFRVLLSRTREMALEAFENQGTPFDSVIQHLRPPRDLSRNPLFQVLFQLKRAPPSTTEASQSTGQDRIARGAMFDLVFDLVETNEGIIGAIEYAADLFEHATIAQMVECYQTVLEAAVAEPETTIWRLPLLGKVQVAALVAAWDGFGNPFQPEDSQRVLHRMVSSQAERSPESLAVEDQNTRWSYRELEGRSNRVARRLRNMGVRNGDFIGIAVDRSVEMVAAVLGILKAGGAYVPLDLRYPAERVQFMVRDAKIAIVIGEANSTLLDDNSSAHLAVIGSPAFDTESSAPVDFEVRPSDLAYMIYTSGSTGEPKGVLVEHRHITQFLHEIQRAIGATAKDRWLAVSSLSFDISILELFLPLSIGGSVVVAEQSIINDATLLANRIASAAASIMQATPSMWCMLMDAGWAGQAGLRLLSGGETLHADVATELFSRGDELWNLYGPTETTVWASCSRIMDPHSPITIGRPLPHLQFRVLDREGAPAPMGAPGELYIGGSGVARGYHDRAALTEQRFVLKALENVERYYRTGDLCRFRSDHSFEFIERIDDQLKVRGFRVEAGEVETTLRSHPAVRDAIVVANDFGGGDRRLVAYVTLGNAISPSDLRNFLKTKLPDHAVPSAVLVLAALPLTPNGKVNRALLAKAALPEANPEIMDVQTPETKTEIAILDICRTVLKTGSVGLDDNFFEVGGHSLLATQLVSRIRSICGVEVPLRTVFESHTLRQLADAVDTLRWISRGEARPEPFETAAEEDEI